MEPNRELATWLLANRREIERVMAERLGPAAPQAAGPEAETLRRFRTFASTALMRGNAPTPALDGLRPNERRVMALLGAWTHAATEMAGPDGEALSAALRPLLDLFRVSLRTTGSGRRAKGTPRASRRAVVAAIDRVADAFIAIDVDDGKIADANPAAGAMLGVDRDALLGIDIFSFVPPTDQPGWWTRFDGIAEGDEQQHFPADLCDVNGSTLRLQASATAYATKGRTLALVLLRPQRDAGVASRPQPLAGVPLSAT
jgi:PAS domain S-box-containing protein